MIRFIRRYFLFIFVLFLIILGGVGSYFFNNNISYENPKLIAESEIKTLSEEVGKLIVLPNDEIPTVATVADPKALQTLENQAFFAEAKKGDKVLIFYSAKKAILYDPIIKKIINVAPVNIGSFKKSAEVPPNIAPKSAPINSNTKGPVQF